MPTLLTIHSCHLVRDERDDYGTLHPGVEIGEPEHAQLRRALLEGINRKVYWDGDVLVINYGGQEFRLDFDHVCCTMVKAAAIEAGQIYILGARDGLLVKPAAPKAVEVLS